MIMLTENVRRRRFLQASAAVALAPYIRTSRAAGSLSVAFWDHWVPGANEVLARLCKEWAAKEKVDVKIDFITSLGNKLVLTVTAEAQAKSGHDLISMGTWNAANQAANLEPVNEIVQDLIRQEAAPATLVENPPNQERRWTALPAKAARDKKRPSPYSD